MTRTVVFFVAALVVFAAVTAGFGHGGGSAGLLSDEERLGLKFSANDGTDGFDIVEQSPDTTVFRSGGTDDTDPVSPTAVDDDTASPPAPVDKGDGNSTLTNGVADDSNVTDGSTDETVTDSTTGMNGTEDSTTGGTFTNRTETTSNNTVAGGHKSNATNGTEAGDSNTGDGIKTTQQLRDDAATRNGTSPDRDKNVPSDNETADTNGTEPNKPTSEAMIDSDVTGSIDSEATGTERPEGNSDGTDGDTAPKETDDTPSVDDNEGNDSGSSEDSESESDVAPPDRPVDTNRSEQLPDGAEADVTDSDTTGKGATNTGEDGAVNAGSDPSPDGTGAVTDSVTP
jgi:hypothetical protein